MHVVVFYDILTDTEMWTTASQARRVEIKPTKRHTKCKIRWRAGRKRQSNAYRLKRNFKNEEFIQSQGQCHKSCHWTWTKDITNTFIKIINNNNK